MWEIYVYIQEEVIKPLFFLKYIFSNILQKALLQIYLLLTLGLSFVPWVLVVKGLKEHFLPFACNVGAGDADTSANQAVSVHHLHHFGKLLLQVSMELFVSHRKSVE